MPEGNVSLQAHPDSADLGITGLEVHWVRNHFGLQLAYRLEGQLAGLQLPSFEGLQRGEQLWEQTCFEVFLAQPGSAGYREYNFAPSGAWAGYLFADYRDPAPGVMPPPDMLQCHCEAGALTLIARLSAAALPEGPLACGLSAVLLDRGGHKAWWALQHGEALPDFHQRESFALALPA